MAVANERAGHSWLRVLALEARIAAIIAALALVLAVLPAHAQKPDWQQHLDWCIGNYTTDPGKTDCPERYVKTRPDCLVAGGRACLMKEAIETARKDCARAFELALICQCHDGGNQAAVRGAGTQAVCDYLRTK